MSSIKVSFGEFTALTALAYTYNMEENSLENELHPLVNIIKKRVLDLINKKRSEGLSDDKLGELCGFSKTYMYEIRKKLKGDRFTLNSALKIWTGLGHPAETLIADCNVEPLLAARIKRIQAEEYRELFELLVEVLFSQEFIAEPDKEDLIEIKALLKSLKRRITSAKEQPPGNPGVRSSNLFGE